MKKTNMLFRIMLANLFMAASLSVCFFSVHAETLPEVPQASAELEALIQEWIKPWSSDTWVRDSRVIDRPEITTTEEQALRVGLDMILKIDGATADDLSNYIAAVTADGFEGGGRWKVQLFSKEFAGDKTVPHRYEIEVSYYFPMMISYFVYDVDGIDITSVFTLDEEGGLVETDYETYLRQAEYRTRDQ